MLLLHFDLLEFASDLFMWKMFACCTCKGNFLQMDTFISFPECKHETLNPIFYIYRASCECDACLRVRFKKEEKKNRKWLCIFAILWQDDTCVHQYHHNFISKGTWAVKCNHTSLINSIRILYSFNLYCNLFILK